MSIRPWKMFRVVCNGEHCLDESDDYPTPGEAWASLNGLGWTRRYNKHFCQSCTTKRKTP